MESEGPVKVDKRTLVREYAAFVPRPADGKRVFLMTHEPPGEPSGGVLIFSSIYADFLANYQREVNLARHLACAGYLVMRFHYTGTGNSDGDNSNLSLTSLFEDSAWATAALREKVGDLPCALVGTRWGALCASAVAGSEVNCPVVLCEPVIDFQKYFSDAIRSRAMSAIASGADGGAAVPFEDLIESRGYADIVGNVIHGRFYKSVTGASALDFFDTLGRPGLLLQFGGRQLRPEYKKLAEELESRQWNIESSIIDLMESWWFRAGQRVLCHDELNRVTEGWIDAQLSPSESQR